MDFVLQLMENGGDISGKHEAGNRQKHLSLHSTRSLVG